MSFSTDKDTPEMETFGPLPPVQGDTEPPPATWTEPQGIKLDQHKARTDLITWEGFDLIPPGNWALEGDVPHGTVYSVETLRNWWSLRMDTGLYAAAANTLLRLQGELTGFAPARNFGPYMGRVPVALLAVGQVLAFGAKKYAARNWENGIVYSRVYAAAQRHLLAHLSGETRDPETGLPHLAHAGCCLMFLLTFEARGMGNKLDDRPKAKALSK